MKIYEYYASIGVKNEALLSIAVILITAFLFTRVSKLLRLPDVSAYIVAGIIIGPGVLGLISPAMVEASAFLRDFALACVSFGIGKHFTARSLIKGGLKTLIITLVQALLTGIAVTVAVKLCGQSWEVAFLLGAIAIASSPTSTMVTINQYRAKGEFVDKLLQIVALSDVICILLFSVVLAFCGQSENSASAEQVILPVVYNLIAIAVGIGCGFLTGGVIKRRSPNNRLMLGLAMLALLSATCGILGVSPLLCCMFYGATYVNFTKDTELFGQMDKFMPPVNCVFFALSGMSFQLSSLFTSGLIVVAFFLVRIAGKYLGCMLGCAMVKTSRPIRNLIGFTLLPQASVSIGLATLALGVLPKEAGEVVSGIVIASAVLYELIGPALSKMALIKSGAIGEAAPIIGREYKTEAEVGWDKPSAFPVYESGENFVVVDPLVGSIPPYEPQKTDS